jgi:GNAT superfamily N-acetyltransferase
MRAIEFIVETQELDEIERISPSAYSGGKESLYNKQFGKQVKKLPGGSGLLYSTSESRYGGTDIKLWDPNGKDYVAQKSREQEPKPVQKRREANSDYRYRLRRWEEYQLGLNAPGQLIGKLSVSDARYFPLKGAVQVDTITVDEDYRGVGLAKALYGIVLTIMKRPLLAGSSQTPGGRKNWVSLANIPGVQMKGYLSFDEEEMEPLAPDEEDDAWDKRYKKNHNKQFDKRLDIIMGQLGGQYIGAGRYDDEYFAFDVKPNTTRTELEAHVKTKLNAVYGNYNSNSGLYAVWTGQA